MQTGTDKWAENPDSCYIETASGKRFYFNAPVFDRSDCAAATSKQCRYTGHVRKFLSVAEHQILVSEIMEYLELGDPFEGANHDNTEYVMADMSSPLKALIPQYRTIETTIDTEFRRQLGLPLHMTDGCKRADWIALFIEAAVLIPSGGKSWPAPPGIKEQAYELSSRFWIRNWTPATAEREWLARWHQLAKGRPDYARLIGTI